MRYPSRPASTGPPAPKTADGVSLRLNQELCAGVITATRGFSCSEISLAFMGAPVGKAGYRLFPSGSWRLRLTIAGRGTNANTNPPATDVSIPLTINRVERNDSH